MDKSIIAQTLRAYRSKKKITQAQLSKEIGRTVINISHHEGTAELPQFLKFYEIVKQLNCKVSIKVETDEGETLLEINR